MRLEVDGLFAGYNDEVDVLKNVSLRAEPGQVIGLIGANGAGKSTLLRSICGQVHPHRGSVSLGGREITGLRPDRLSGEGVGYLMEGHSVFPAMSVEENLMLGSWAWRKDRARVRRAMEKAYVRSPILREKRHARAGLLSGGQQRILEVERLCLGEPSLILLDELSLGLSPKLTNEMFARLASLRGEGTTIVVVDQSARHVAEIADYVYVLRLGEIQTHAPGVTFRGRIEDVVRGFI